MKIWWTTGFWKVPETVRASSDRPEPAPPGAGLRGPGRHWQGSWLQRLMPFFLAHRRKAVLTLAATVVGQLAAAAVPLLQKIIIDDAIIANRHPLLPWLVLLLAAAALNALATVIRRANGNAFGFALQHDLRDAVYRHVQRLEIGTGDAGGFSTGEVISRSTADITLVQTLFSQMHVLLGSLIMVAAALGVMAYLSPALSLIMLVSLPLMWLVARRLRHEVFPAVWSDQRAQARLAGEIGETIWGARVVRAFGQERRELARLTGTARGLFASRVRTSRITARFAPMLQVVPALGQLAVLAFGGWLVLRGQVTVGTFLAFFSYLVQLVAPVRTLAGALTTAQQARAGAERVLELLDHTPAITEKPGAPPLRLSGGAVTFRNVTFGYSAAAPLLDGLTLDLAAGETLAVVGASGSGKSTLAQMLVRLHDPASGQILIDGQDISGVTLASLRRAVGIVFEEPFLFSGTVAENIARGQSGATRARIEAASRIAGADEFIRALPQGYDTPVAELGATLSGGQRQRLTLARALLTEPGVLVLDDATSAIDARTEAQVLEAMRDALHGRTTLIVARRRSTLALAHRIVLLDRGRIADAGTHEELVARSPAYRQLLETELAPGDLAEAPQEAGDGPEAAAWPEETAGMPEDAAPLHFVESVQADGHARQTAPTAAMLATTGAASIQSRVAALPPAEARPAIDEAFEATDTGPFRLPAFLKPYRRGLLAGVGLIMADTLAGLTGPVLVGWGLDGIVSGREDLLWLASAGFAVALVLAWIIGRALTLQTARTAERILFALRIRVFAQLQRLSVDRFEREDSGRIMARATSDIEALSTFLQQGLLTSLVSLTTCGGILAVLALLEPRLALAMAIVLPVLAVATEWYRRASARAYETSRQKIASVYAGIQEGVSGGRVTRALAGEQGAATRFRHDSDSYRASRERASRIAALYFPFLQFLAVVAKAAVLLAGAALVARGELAIGVLAAFLLYADQFFAPVQQVSQAFDQWLQAGASLRRLREFLDERSQTPAPVRPERPPEISGAFRLVGVGYSYPGAPAPAVKDLTLEIPAGQMLAVVGKTGAGKSTLARLLARFADPDRGQVLLDGVALTRFDPDSLRSHLAYVPQEPMLFATTVAANIAYGRPGATPAKIEAVARRVGAHAFIRRLPQGYRTVLAEQGRSLSAGQRQLLCLARALLPEPRVLILDEATAQIDLRAEALVRRVLAAERGKRTVILIAHRLQTVLQADRILLMEAGQLAEDGSPEDLLRQNGPFAALHAVSGGGAPSPRDTPFAAAQDTPHTARPVTA